MAADTRSRGRCCSQTKDTLKNKGVNINKSGYAFCLVWCRRDVREMLQCVMVYRRTRFGISRFAIGDSRVRLAIVHMTDRSPLCCASVAVKTDKRAVTAEETADNLRR